MPVEVGLRVLMWASMVGVVFHTATFFSILEKVKSNDYATILFVLFVVAILIDLIQCAFFIKFIQNDTPETRLRVA